MRGLQAVLVAAAMLAPCACGLDRGGLLASQPDAAGAHDDAGDGAASDDGPVTPGDDAAEAAAGCILDSCIGACCSACETGGIFCPSAAGGPGGTCVSDCAQCASTGGDSGTTCFDCVPTLTARCDQSADSCPPDIEAGACPCPSATAEECPGPRQSCEEVDGTFVCLSN